MQVDLNDDELDRLAEQLVDRLPDLLLDRNVQRAPDDDEILGIDPHCLYSVRFVADRWNVSTDTVYRLSDEELPRAEWQGSGVRFRGAAILEYEGVDVYSQEFSSTAAPSQDATALGAPTQDAPAREERTAKKSSETDDDSQSAQSCTQNLPEL